MRISFLTMTFVGLVLVGCGDKTPEQSEQAKSAQAPQTEQSVNAPTTKTPTGEKVYTVLTYPEYAPYEYMDERGNIIGFDVDMINAIAQAENMKVEVKQTPWVGMLDELNQGDGDLVISGISRQQSGGSDKYALSNAYLHGRDAILTKDTTFDINTMADLVTHNVGVQHSTIFAEEMIKRKGKGSPTLQQTETSYLAFKELVMGNVEAVYAHENILRHYAKGQPKFKFKLGGTGEGFELYDMVVVAKKGNNELINKINAGIQKVHQDGTYQKLHLKWFGVEPPKPMPKPQPTASQVPVMPTVHAQ